MNDSLFVNLCTKQWTFHSIRLHDSHLMDSDVGASVRNLIEKKMLCRNLWCTHCSVIGCVNRAYLFLLATGEGRVHATSCRQFVTSDYTKLQLKH